MTAWLSSKIAPWLILAGFVTGSACLFWSGVSKVDGWIEDARTEARAGRDHYWREQIARANEETAKAEAALARQAMERSAELATAEETIRLKQDELEKANAAIPDNSGGGIGHDRVRLLNRR